MKSIFADFNARTESGDFRLNCEASRDDLRDFGTKLGDWMWLSDGELVVGAQLAADDRYGLVGAPRWNTLVHLDDDDTQELADVWDQFLRLPREPGLDSGTETRVFQLLTILEAIAPATLKATLPPEYFASRRAAALRFLGESELAMIEIEAALEAKPDDPDLGYLYLETLRGLDSDRAAIEAGRRAEAAGVTAPVIAACINIWSAAADRASDEEFETKGLKILDWVARFERAPGRDRVRASVLAQVQFNQGLTLLRLGRFEEARDAFGRAHATNPNEPAIDEASRLDRFDDRARRIAAGMREQHPMIAA